MWTTTCKIYCTICTHVELALYTNYGEQARRLGPHHHGQTALAANVHHSVPLSLSLSVLLSYSWTARSSIQSYVLHWHCLQMVERDIVFFPLALRAVSRVTFSPLKGVCLLHLLSENIFPVLRTNWFYVLMKQKLIWNLSLCYFSLFCFYLSGYDDRTAERKSDSTWRTWYKQTARVYHSRRPISWLIPEMQYPVIYIIKFSNN